jgi:hypothetical protein
MRGIMSGSKRIFLVPEKKRTLWKQDTSGERVELSRNGSGISASFPLSARYIATTSTSSLACLQVYPPARGRKQRTLKVV